MSSSEVTSILNRARNDAANLHIVLADLLSVIFRERSYPLDPNYVTPTGCRALLSRRPEIGSLLQEAIEKGNS